MKPLYIWRKNCEAVRHLFASELAARLCRSRRAILRDGLFDKDFPHQRVRVYYDSIDHPDSTFDFGFAFVIIVPRRHSVAVFSNHAGYYVFNHLCVIAIQKPGLPERIIWKESDWWRHEKSKAKAPRKSFTTRAYSLFP